jgi:DNA-binding protein Fis
MSRGQHIELEHFPSQDGLPVNQSAQASATTRSAQLRAVVIDWMKDQIDAKQPTGLYELFLEEVEPALFATALVRLQV